MKPLNKNKKTFVLLILIFGLLTNILSPNNPTASSKAASRPAKPKLTVCVKRIKNSYRMYLYMNNVAGAKYAEARWKPSMHSSFQNQKLRKINHANPVEVLDMGKYKTIYIQIRTYNKKGIYSKYSRLIKVKRTDYKKSNKKKTSPTKAPAATPASPSATPDKTTTEVPVTTPQNPSATPDKTTTETPPSPSPDQNVSLSVTASADTNTPFSHQTVKISVFTNIEATSVTVASKTNTNTYGPFNMIKNGTLTWYFDAEFFESGEHQIIITAYRSSGETCTTSFTLNVRSLF